LNIVWEKIVRIKCICTNCSSDLELQYILGESFIEITKYKQSNNKMFNNTHTNKQTKKHEL